MIYLSPVKMAISDERPMMSLRVSRNDQIADGIHLIELRDLTGRPLPEFSAGAHITIRVPNGLLRDYSLCSDPAERDRYQVAVKREAKGLGGSGNLIDNAMIGDLLMATAPIGKFVLPASAQSFLFIAGGIGISPIMAMIHKVGREGKHFRLFYCARSAETTAFVDELSAAKFNGKVFIHYDYGDPARSLDLKEILIGRKDSEHLLCCGPRPLMEAVRSMSRHWTSTAVHFASADAQAEKLAIS